jgi:hypothetical protein
MTISLLWYAHSLQTEPYREEEYRAKASFLSKFPLFVEWSEGALPSTRAPFLICVFADFSFGVSLAEMTRGTTSTIGVWTLLMLQGTLRFDASLAKANRSHLKMRSQLLALARHVVTQPEAAKI